MGVPFSFLKRLARSCTDERVGEDPVEFAFVGTVNCEGRELLGGVVTLALEVADGTGEVLGEDDDDDSN